MAYCGDSGGTLRVAANRNLKQLRLAVGRCEYVPSTHVLLVRGQLRPHRCERRCGPRILPTGRPNPHACACPPCSCPDCQERLPKALIHRNVPGEAVHAYLEAVDSAWDRAAAQSSYGVRQRWVTACTGMREQGWPVLDGPRRWRLGELSVAWEAVAPQRA